MARAIARGLARPPSLAEDVVQEAALAVFRAWKQDPLRFPRLEDARGYFLRTTRNLALKTRRTVGREEPLGDLPPPSAVDPEAERLRERQERLMRLLRELEPGARNWIEQRFLERKTLAVLAAETGIPLSTLHSREQALLAKLRSKLDQEEAG